MVADAQSSVRLNVRTGELEVTGTEQFVERIVGTVPSLFSTISESLRHVPQDPPDGNKDRHNQGNAGDDDAEGSSLAKFIAEKKLQKDSPHEDLVTAFVYYLAKIKKTDPIGTNDISLCYEEAAIPKPKKLTQTLSNLMQTGPGRKGYIGSAGRGHYKLTIPGENHVVKMG